ncbi:MAG: hypothetical protein LBK04_03290 [Clostridiales Family XIII bacterium]|jgi:hypothetical protein|nr:hypothetical protein [Clostridiales Family XIII bacterium]
MKKQSSSFRKRAGFGTSMGVPSIIAILVILVLVVFASLSVVMSKADFQLTEKTEESISAYYKADAAATEKMAEVADAAQAGGDWADALSAGGYDVTSSGGAVTVAYTVEVDRFRVLDVSLSVEPGGYLAVKGWKLVPTEDWVPDDSIQLFQ